MPRTSPTGSKAQFCSRHYPLPRDIFCPWAPHSSPAPANFPTSDPPPPTAAPTPAKLREVTWRKAPGEGPPGAGRTGKAPWRGSRFTTHPGGRLGGRDRGWAGLPRPAPVSFPRLEGRIKRRVSPSPPPSSFFLLPGGWEGGTGSPETQSQEMREA